MNSGGGILKLWEGTGVNEEGLRSIGAERREIRKFL